MRVLGVNAGVSFGRALRPEETEEFTNTVKEAKQLAGQTGKSVFIMPSQSLPQSSAKNTGVGNFASKESVDFLNYMKTYLDFNVVEDLPQGQIKKNGDFYCNYESSALALGEQNINPELLTKSEFGSILKPEEFDEIVNANSKKTKDSLANFENVVDNGSAQDKALKTAYERFKVLDENSELKQRYNKFVTENDSWLNFVRENETDTDYFKFKQFLAEEHLEHGRKELNANGMKLCGDVPINFTDDEVKAFPNAFKKDHYVGVPSWKIPSLDYDTILDESSDAHKLLKSKVQLAAKRYDLLRFDAAWNYVTPVVTPKGENNILDHNRKYQGSNVLNLIEKWVKEVKGEDFDLKNLMYEFEAGVHEFSPFWDGQLIEPVKNRVKIYGSTFMSDDWGSNDAFLKRGWSPDEFSIGVGNHDPQPLKQIARGVPDIPLGWKVHLDSTLAPLARILKLDAASLREPKDYCKARFAEPMMAKNNHFFFMDVFGRVERFNEHGCDTGLNVPSNFRRKVPADYIKQFHQALQEGFGFNIADSLEKVFKAKGLDESHADLYAKIVKFRDILTEKEEFKPVVKETIKETSTKPPVAAVVDAAEKTSVSVNEKQAEQVVKEAVKKGKSFKPFLLAAGAAALVGGGYAFFRNRHPKTAQN